MNLFDLPELQFLIARLHQRDLLLSRRECSSRPPRGGSGPLRSLIGAYLIVLGRTGLRLGARLLGTRAAPGRG